MKQLSHRQPTRLRNRRCAYCNAEFTRSDEPQKEHVIGRLFVPRGSLEQQWNLHINSCHACNQRKSTLENDISAISIFATEVDSISYDESLVAEKHRKSKAFSNRTRKLVAESGEIFEVHGNVGSAQISFTMRGPPQLDDERAFKLALFQLQAFHFFLTYDQSQEQGFHWRGVYSPLDFVNDSDWGNPLIVAFSDLTLAWDLRLDVNTSKGHYRALVKKNPSAAVWSWAMEWNKYFRIFGFYGDEVAIEAIFADLSGPVKIMEEAWIEMSPTRRYRMEVPVDAEADKFFDVARV